MTPDTKALLKMLDNTASPPAINIGDLLEAGEPHAFRCTVTGNLMVRFGEGTSAVGPYRAKTPPLGSKWAKIDPQNQGDPATEKKRKRGSKDDGKNDGKNDAPADARKKSRSDTSTDGRKKSKSEKTLGKPEQPKIQKTQKSPKRAVVSRKKAGKTKVATAASTRSRRNRYIPVKFGVDEYIEGIKTSKTMTKKVLAPKRASETKDTPDWTAPRGSSLSSVSL